MVEIAKCQLRDTISAISSKYVRQNLCVALGVCFSILEQHKGSEQVDSKIKHNLDKANNKWYETKEHSDMYIITHIQSFILILLFLNL